MNLFAATMLIGQAAVIDGDTMRVGELKVRLWGLDAAELNTQEGVAAKQVLQSLIEEKEVRCEPNGSISYDRIVAKCFIDGKRYCRMDD